MTDFKFPTRVCYNCKKEKIICMHFSPCSNLCCECRKEKNVEMQKKQPPSDPKLGWKTHSHGRKGVKGWKAIYG